MLFLDNIIRNYSNPVIYNPFILGRLIIAQRNFYEW
ncbi:Uncharacterised protein [Salmonella enterica subsp. houtenae]|nr:Uncharacterised protein [Salmonella enterica subsp. houtenae]